MEFDEAKAQSTGFKKNLKYITVSNSKTGFVVYERVFKWPENTITANLGSLIQSFYQFAREVDDGNITSIVFEEHKIAGKRRPKNSSSKYLDTMKMVSSKVEPIIITAFYDMKGQYSLPSDGTRQRLANLLDVIEERFNIHCIETFNRMESKIIHLIDSNEDHTREIEEIRSHFLFFDEILDNILAQF